MKLQNWIDEQEIYALLWWKCRMKDETDKILAKISDDARREFVAVCLLWAIGKSKCDNNTKKTDENG